MHIHPLLGCLFFLLLICFAIGGDPVLQGSKDTTVRNCLNQNKSCPDVTDLQEIVCGTNGRTYRSLCHLNKAQCRESVTISHRGRCDEKIESCDNARMFALHSKGSRHAYFVPRCRRNGMYAPIQCATKVYPSIGRIGCWCVSSDGKALPDTSVSPDGNTCYKNDTSEEMSDIPTVVTTDTTEETPDILSVVTTTDKSHARRRSSVRGQHTKRPCSHTDRSLFNANLLKIFKGENDRSRTAKDAVVVEMKDVAEWKFKELDRDNSGTLQKSEYRGLRKLIKKVVKPKRCARAWGRICDENGDNEITRAEWNSCLLSNPEPPAPDYESGGPEQETDYGEEETPPDPSAMLPGIMRNSFAPDGSDVESRRDEEANDCHTDRQAALDEQKTGGAALYVPECTGDGRYARAQCYSSTGYCWCVHQDTGKPIPGSSVKDRRPDCDAAPQHASPMRGCPEPTKTIFLSDLMNFFITKMTASNNGTAPGEMVKWGVSKQEQAAAWTFVMLDKDKNKLLERREWKAFHQLISNIDSLRRCGRKLPRYCDVNHDAKISITEWMACLEVTQGSQDRSTEKPKVPTNSKRKGPNPLESILKADD